MFELEYSEENGVRRYVSRNGDKDGSLVSARLAGATGGVCARALNIEVNREVNGGFIGELAARTVQWYTHYGGMREGNPLLNPDTLVLGSVHRAALYVAECLHAPVLSLQFMGFAESWEAALRATGTAIVGGDHDWPGLWIWNKISRPEDVPPAYVELMQDARRIVLVRSTDSDADCPVKWKLEHLYINASLERDVPARTLLSEVRAHLDGLDQEDNLGQWEWGLPDKTLDAVRVRWEQLGKRIEDFHVIEADTISLYIVIPRLWQRYLAKNNCEVRGISLNSYWFAQPSWERAAAILPFPSYSFRMLENVAKAYFRDFQDGMATVAAFTNDVGAKDDPKRIAKFLASQGCLETAWFSNGLDGLAARCQDQHGTEIMAPHQKVAEWLQREAPHRDNIRAFEPLTVEDIKELFVPETYRGAHA